MRIGTVAQISTPFVEEGYDDRVGCRRNAPTPSAATSRTLNPELTMTEYDERS
jgi:hypothetical protein